MLLKDQERIKVTSGLVEVQLADLKSLVDDATANRKNARRAVGDETLAMTLLMINNEIDQNRKRLAALEERFHVELSNKKDNLVKTQADNRREQANYQTEIDKLETVLKNIRRREQLLSLPSH